MKNKLCKSMPIVGGVQSGHPHLNPKNHASKGIVADMPIATNMAKVFSKKNSAKRLAIKSIQGEK